MLDRVLQLAHVARPVVALEQGLDLGREAHGRTAVLPRRAVEEVGGQQPDVLAPLAQRRQLDLHHVEPVVEVLAEAPGLGLGQQVAVRGGDHADVHHPQVVVAEAAQLAALERAQQLHLGGGRHVADLVEEERAAVGALDQALAVAGGPGEGPAHVSRTTRSRSATRAGRPR